MIPTSPIPSDEGYSESQDEEATESEQADEDDIDMPRSSPPIDGEEGMT